MNEITALHEKAMELAELAFIARHKGNLAEATRLTEQAYEFEAQAARMTALGLEPTRSVLYRSAASLAVQAGRLDEAFALAREGLAGNPPDEIKEELWEVIIDACPNVNMTDLMNII